MKVKKCFICEKEYLLKTLPEDKWYDVIYDSDGDFIITNAENKDILPDLFHELKRKRDER